MGLLLLVVHDNKAPACRFVCWVVGAVGVNISGGLGLGRVAGDGGVRGEGRREWTQRRSEEERGMDGLEEFGRNVGG